MSAESIDRMHPISRAKLYYAAGFIACALALVIEAFERIPLFAYLPLAPAAVFLSDRLCEEIVLMRRERKPRS